MRHHYPSSALRLFAVLGVLAVLALLAWGSGSWMAGPVSAQRATVPTRTPTPAPATPKPATPAPTAVATPVPPTPVPTPAPTTTAGSSDAVQVAPLTSLPVVGAWLPAIESR